MLYFCCIFLFRGDLHSMFFYPYLVQGKRLSAVYFIASRILMRYPKISSVTIDKIITNHHGKFGGSVSNTQSWINNLRVSDKD